MCDATRCSTNMCVGGRSIVYVLLLLLVCVYDDLYAGNVCVLFMLKVIDLFGLSASNINANILNKGSFE